jgi:hypothetical protein
VPSWSGVPEDSRKKGRGGRNDSSGVATGSFVEDLDDDDDDDEDMAGECRRTTARESAPENSEREQRTLRCREYLRQVE